MDALIFSSAFASISAAVFLLGRQFDKRILVSFALLSALYLAADDFVTGLPSLIKGISFPGSHWNWSGKILSIGLSVAVIKAFGMSPASIGLTIRQRHTGIGLVAIALFIAWGAFLGLFFKPGAPDAETLAFQATMPGLSEELVYRGILPALLLGLIHRKNPINDMPWAIILSTSVLFGAWHGLSYTQGQFGFDLMSALFPFIGSIPGCWLRFKTGSLVFPILVHSLANVAFHVAGWFGA